jgi:hypothetical protein
MRFPAGTQRQGVDTTQRLIDTDGGIEANWQINQVWMA